MRRGNAAIASSAVALLVLALLVVFGLELADTQAKSKRDVRARVNERAVLASALIESLFESSAQQAPLLRRLYGTAAVDDAVLEEQRKTNRYLVLMDASGRVLARSRGVTPSIVTTVRESAAVRSVARGRLYGLGDVHGRGGAAVADFVVPVSTDFGRRVLVSGVPLAALSGFIGRELKRIPGVKGARNYLLDGRRAIIASTDPNRRPGYVFRSPSQVAALSRKSGEVNGRYYDQVALANSGWHLVVAAPSKALFANVSGLRKWVPWLIFLAFAAATAVAFALARRVLRSAAEARAAGEQLARINAELEHTNAELARRAAELARSNDELDQFASIASHDLQEPLRKVRTFTQQLTVMEAQNLSEKGQDYLRRAESAAERMQRLVEDLLRFSRVATDARPFSRVDLAEVVAGVLDDLSHEIDRVGAVVRVEDLPTVGGDPLQLRQLVQNLVSNALKFRREGVAPEVTIAAEVGDGVVTLTVADNGIGFEPQYGERIFRVFERLHGRSAYPGTGIGLALCRKIAERHGGSIRAEGRPGEGARFVVVLPADRREEVIVVGRPDLDAPLPIADPREEVHG